MNEERLRQAFTEGLGIDGDIDWAGLTYRGIREWDSVAHMQLIAELEESFGVMLDTSDVIAMSSFTIAKEILQRYGVSFG